MLRTSSDHSFSLQAQDFQADGKPLDDFTNLFDQGYQISFSPEVGVGFQTKIGW
jgi:hypothetical protein